MKKNSSTPEEKLHFLSTFGIIRSAIKIPCRSFSFIAFTFLTSLPLLCTMFVERLLVKRDFFHIPDLLMQLSPQLYNLFYAANMVIDWVTKILRLGPFELFNFFTAVSTVYSASRIYTSGTGRSKVLQDLLQNFNIKSRWNKTLLTFLFMSMLTYISVDAFSYWANTMPKLLHENTFLQLLYFMLYFLVLSKWMEYSSLWETAVVISILEEKKLFEAFSSSAKLTKGRRIQGAILSTIIVVVLAIMFAPTIVEGRTFNRGIDYVVQDWSLKCVGKAMSWVVLVVYYHDCKNRQKEKMIMEKCGENEQV